MQHVPKYDLRRITSAPFHLQKVYVCMSSAQLKQGEVGPYRINDCESELQDLGPQAFSQSSGAYFDL